MSAISASSSSASSFGESLQVGCLVDCRDSRGKMYCAQVVEVGKEHVVVRFCTWPEEYNERIVRTSDALQPFRTHKCCGYGRRCSFECIPPSLASDVYLVAAVREATEAALKAPRGAETTLKVKMIAEDEQHASTPADLTLTHNDCVVDHVIDEGCRFTVAGGSSSGSSSSSSSVQDVAACLHANWRLIVTRESAASKQARKQARKEHESKRAECEKQLIQLPVQLQQVESALAVRREERKQGAACDARELGELLIQQDDIAIKIAQQQQLKDELEKGPQLPAVEYERIFIRPTYDLRIGPNCIGDQVYWLHRQLTAAPFHQHEPLQRQEEEQVNKGKSAEEEKEDESKEAEGDEGAVTPTTAADAGVATAATMAVPATAEPAAPTYAAVVATAAATSAQPDAAVSATTAALAPAATVPIAVASAGSVTDDNAVAAAAVPRSASAPSTPDSASGSSSPTTPGWLLVRSAESREGAAPAATTAVAAAAAETAKKAAGSQ